MRRVLFISTSRADFGIWQPVLRCAARAQQAGLLEPGLVLASAMLDEAGRPSEQLDNRGVRVVATVGCLPQGDRPIDACAASARAVDGFARAFEANRPELVMVLGDRYEMHAAAVAAVMLSIPLGHVHGGEVTLGAVDELFRHSMTKLAQVHFVATKSFAGRLIQMGEPADRVHVTGAPGLDELPDPRQAASSQARSQLAAELGLSLDEPFLLATIHPETATGLSAAEQTAALFGALRQDGRRVIFTDSNHDPQGMELNQRVAEACSRYEPLRHWARIVQPGRERYLRLMALADSVVGNSSSGILEAASFAKPVINIGRRQEGRLRAGNVIDCPWEAAAINQALIHAGEPAFLRSLNGLVNPYGDGRAGGRIVDIIVSLDGRLLLPKPFVDVEPPLMGRVA